MASGEKFSICSKRKSSAVSQYSNFSNINLGEDNAIFSRFDNETLDSISNISNYNDTERNINIKGGGITSSSEANQQVNEQVSQQDSLQVNRQDSIQVNQQVNQQVNLQESQQVNQQESQQVNQQESQQVNQYDNQQVNQHDYQQVNQYDNQQVNQHDCQQVNQHDSQQVNQQDSQQVNQQDNHQDNHQVHQYDNRHVTLQDSQYIIRQFEQQGDRGTAFPPDFGDTISYISLSTINVYDAGSLRSFSKSMRSNFDYEFGETTTADAVYGDHSTRNSLIGDRPLKSTDYMYGLAAFLCHLFTVGMTQITAVLVIKWLQSFPNSESLIVSIPPVIYGIMSGSGLLVGLLMNIAGGAPIIVIGGFIQGLALVLASFAYTKYFLFFTVAILFGFGCSLVYVTVFVVVGVYFGTRATLFLSILSIAGPVGGILFTLIVPVILDNLHWSSCLMIMGGVSFNICPLGLFILICHMRAHKNPMEHQFMMLKTSKKILDLSVFKNAMFSIFLVPLCFTSGDMNFTLGIFASFLNQKSLTLTQTTHVISLMCLASIIIRLLVGLLLRLTGWRFIYLYLILSVGFGLTVIITTYCSGFTAMTICAIIIGLFQGSPSGQYPIVILDFVGSVKYSSAIGITETSNGLITVVEGFLAGFILSLTGTYDTPFRIFAGACVCFNGLLLLLILLQRKIRSSKLEFINL
ncbi:monocarboxylate transporter 4-like [Argonauta hians]